MLRANGQHRSKHLSERRIVENLSVEKGFGELSEVINTCTHRARATRRKALCLRSELFVQVISVGHVGCKFRSIDQARLRHPKGSKNRFLRQLIQWFPLLLFNQKL